MYHVKATNFHIVPLNQIRVFDQPYPCSFSRFQFSFLDKCTFYLGILPLNGNLCSQRMHVTVLKVNKKNNKKDKKNKINKNK